MRLSDSPEPYAVVVLVPASGPGSAATTVAVNGRVARLIAWMIDHRVQIESMRGGLDVNFGPSSFQIIVRETFPHQPVAPSTLGRSAETTSTETFVEHAAANLELGARTES